ncbi:hypothetical protein CXG81DRAFT_25496 [Caulochytrium protostelioides]|uniref:Uncharacterized protein n=1 Tax=Caulochytrium protostelioides TaxID=1555241 RepID=A0A4P9X958_9FUNG|nr:hypothetical protein CXG81DRAFT_25496 [Caulochytrium protostelioides]|eukprot:RKP01864.1 hypothetical protein CXG81DRAFT_25496 [Caulochytrium protostelioides]
MTVGSPDGAVLAAAAAHGGEEAARLTYGHLRRLDDACAQLESLADTLCRDYLDNGGAAAANDDASPWTAYRQGLLALYNGDRIALAYEAAAVSESAKARADLDGHHLALQNLQYELLHIKQEIARHEAYASRYPDLQMVPVAQFRAEAPPALTSGLARFWDAPEATWTAEDRHALVLARLRWEEQSREKMVKQIRASEAEREALKRALRQQEAKLADIDQRVDKMASDAAVTQSLLADAAADAAAAAATGAAAASVRATPRA